MVQKDPCQPSPCGPNAQCQVINDSPSCSCLSEFTGVPPNCRPECYSNSDCSSQLACINQKCKDPCPGSCGINTECRAISHTPMCVCASGFTGDPFVRCIPQSEYFFLSYVRNFFLRADSRITFSFAGDPVPMDKVAPCSPSPCGPNAVCRELNGAGSCTCLPEYFGNPYEGCRPECIINSDCTSDRACIRSKCQDPCPGTCGPRAVCHVINHSPSCTCLPDHTGDPFSYCNQISKSLITE